MALECWATLTEEKQFEEDKIAALIMSLFPHFYLSLGKFSANSRHHRPLPEPRRKRRLHVALLLFASPVCCAGFNPHFN